MSVLRFQAVSPNVLARHISAYASAVHFFFGSLAVLNGLGLSFVFYYPRAVRIVIFGPGIDLGIWVFSVLWISAVTVFNLSDRIIRKAFQIAVGALSAALACLVLLTASDGASWLESPILFLATSLGFVALVAFRGRLFGQSSKSMIILTSLYLLSFLIVIEISSAVHYSLQSVDVNTTIGKLDAGIELQLSYLSYGLLPWLYVGFLFSWVWVPVVQRGIPRIARIFEANQVPELASSTSNRPSLSSRIANALDPRLFLALALAVFIGYYPYFQNPPWIVGTDAYWRFYDPLVRISSDGIRAAFVKALNERHPIPLIIFYVTHLALQLSLRDAIRLAQALLGMALGFSMWWFLACKKSYGFGLTAFLVSVLSVTTTVGFYAGILANWMVMVVWVLFFAYVGFRGTARVGVRDFLVLLSLSTLLLIMHPWTWGVFAVTVLVAAIIALVQERRLEFRRAGLLLTVIALDIAIAIAAILYLLGTQRWRVSEVLIDYTFALHNPSSILKFWNALTWLTRVWSPFLSPLYLAMGIIGVFALKPSRVEPWVKRLIYAWLFVSAVGSILVAPLGFRVADPSGSETQLWRVLYLTPFPLLATLGVSCLSKIPVREITSADVPTPRNDTYLPGLWFGLMPLVGLGLSLGDPWERLALFLLIPLIGVLLVRSPVCEKKVLSVLILALFILVAFNNTTRALSQLLRDPHNYRH